MKLFVSERRNQIMHLLRDRKRLTVKELATNIGVSEATLRTDLNEMEGEGLLTRTHGGAILNDNLNDGTSFIEREKRNRNEKMQIAKAALSFIEEEQCILLDASSTAMELARYLKKQSTRLTVVTSGVQTALELKENSEINVILLGGMVTKGSSSIEGTLGAGVLDQINIDIMFTSANGFTHDTGLTDFNLYEVQLKREMIRKSRKVIALIDHTKIGLGSSAVFANMKQIDTLITDQPLNKDIVKEITSENIELIIADL